MNKALSHATGGSVKISIGKDEFGIKSVMTALFSGDKRKIVQASTYRKTSRNRCGNEDCVWPGHFCFPKRREEILSEKMATLSVNQDTTIGDLFKKMNMLYPNEKIDIICNTVSNYLTKINVSISTFIFLKGSVAC